MSRDLKNLIDLVEKETKSQAELEHTIHSLKEEIDRLNFTINEQKLLIENLKSQMKDEELEQTKLPSEIDILKDIITTQRKEVESKDKIIDNLNDKLYELSSGIESNGEIIQEEFIKAQKLIVQLTDENEVLKQQIELLQTQLDEINANETDEEDWLDVKAKAKENEELINFKRLNFQLMEENGLLRLELESLKSRFQESLEEALSEKFDFDNADKADLTLKLESLKTKLHEQTETSLEELESVNEKNARLTLELESLKRNFQEQIETNKEQLELVNEKNAILTLELKSLKTNFQEQAETRLEELDLANKKIIELTSELANYKAKLENLQEELSQPAIIAPEDALQFTKMKEELDDFKDKLSKSQKENQELNERLSELNLKVSPNQIEKIEITENFPKRIPLSLFNRMYNLLEEKNRIKIIKLLIQDLQSSNSEIKRNAIRILSILKNDRVYEAFLEMINDEDWLVRYSIIKALSKFEKKSEELKPILKKLSKDADVDVKELALRVLEDISP